MTQGENSTEIFKEKFSSMMWIERKGGLSGNPEIQVEIVALTTGILAGISWRFPGFTHITNSDRKGRRWEDR